jgi:hypothetical protein
LTPEASARPPPAPEAPAEPEAIAEQPELPEIQPEPAAGVEGTSDGEAADEAPPRGEGRGGGWGGWGQWGKAVRDAAAGAVSDVKELAVTFQQALEEAAGEASDDDEAKPGARAKPSMTAQQRSLALEAVSPQEEAQRGAVLAQLEGAAQQSGGFKVRRGALVAGHERRRERPARGAATGGLSHAQAHERPGPSQRRPAMPEKSLEKPSTLRPKQP